MPIFQTLYEDCTRKLLFLLLFGSLLFTGCGSRDEEGLLFEKVPGETLAADAQDSAIGSDASGAVLPDVSDVGPSGVLSAVPSDPSEGAGSDALAAQGAALTAGKEPGPAAQSAGSGQENADTALAGCIVHICGAVRSPGVYELPAGSRLIDAVNAGGGFLPEADQSACNLAAVVTDGCQIYIMTEEESHQEGNGLHTAGIQEPQAQSRQALQEEAGEQKVNLNTADADSLKTLPGIGDSRAAAIIAFREEYGYFQRIEDIMKVSGIKQAAFDKIKDKITV